MNIKNAVSLALCAVFLTACWTGLAESANVPRAAAVYDIAVLERYESFAMDEASGEWMLEDLTWRAAGDAIQAGEMKTSMKTGFMLLSARLCGNACTSALRPELVFTFFSSTPLEMKGVSVEAGGVRYDISIPSQTVQLFGATAEQMVVPMTGELANLPSAIAGTDVLTMVAHGAEAVYQTTVRRNSNNSSREKMESLSFSMLTPVEEAKGLGLETYGLWDVSAAEWAASPVVEVSSEPVSNMICAGDKGDSVKRVQSLLRSLGFLAGGDETDWGPKSIAACVRAQTYYGLPALGSADAELIWRMEHLGRAETLPVQTEIAPKMDALGSLQLAVGRWWLASRVEALGNGEQRGSICVTDASHVLVIADGYLQNNSPEEIGLSWQCIGSLKVGEKSYSCILRIEGDEGNSLSASVLPGEWARMVVCAEVPESIALGSEPMVLRITCGEECLEYTLER